MSWGHDIPQVFNQPGRQVSHMGRLREYRILSRAQGIQSYMHVSVGANKNGVAKREWYAKAVPSSYP